MVKKKKNVSQEEVKLQAEAEERRLAELEAIRIKAENESKQRAEKEQQIRESNR